VDVKSPREHPAAALSHPGRALIASGHLCAWLSPAELLARQAKGIGIEAIEWRDDELCAALPGNSRQHPALAEETPA
jgi:hypothetical protein